MTIGEALLMFTFMIQPAFRISSAFLDVLSLASQLYFLTILIKIQLFFTNCLQWLLVVKLTVFVYLLQQFVFIAFLNDLYFLIIGFSFIG